MKEIFEVLNVKCEGCANSLKKALLAEFGEIEVNLEVTPRTISLQIDSDKREDLKMALRKLGYPLTTDQLNTLQTFSTSAKSFVSCAVGKIDNKANTNK